MGAVEASGALYGAANRVATEALSAMRAIQSYNLQARGWLLVLGVYGWGAHGCAGGAGGAASERGSALFRKHQPSLQNPAFQKPSSPITP